MAFRDELRQSEENLKEHLSGSLENYYQWENNTRDEFLDLVLLKEENEEDE